MYKGPAVAFMPQGPEVPWSGPGQGHNKTCNRNTCKTTAPQSSKTARCISYRHASSCVSQVHSMLRIFCCTRHIWTGVDDSNTEL